MRSLLRGLFTTLITRALLLFVGIVTSVILARALGPEGRGQYALLILIPALLQLFGGLGIDQSVTYLVARRRAEAGGVALTLAAFATTIGLVLIAVYALLDALPAYQELLDTASLERGLLWILVVLLPVNMATLCLVSALLGLERYRLYNIAASIAPIVTLLLLSALLAVGRMDVRGAVIATAGGQLAGLVGSLAAVLGVAPGRVRLVPGLVRDATTYGWKIYGASIAWFLHYRSDMFLVGYIAGPAGLGYYAVAVGLAEKLYMAPSAVGTVLFPRVAAGPEASRQVTPFASRHTLWLTLGLAGTLAIVAWPLVRFLFGVAFLPAVTPLWLLLPGVASLAVGRVISSDLNGRGLPGIVARANAVALIANVALNLWWIPIWGAAGAAAATSISYTSAVYLMGRRYCRETGATWGELLLLTRGDRGQLLRHLAVALTGERRQQTSAESGR